MFDPAPSEIPRPDLDSLVHDARNALAAARGQVDFIRRRVGRGNLVASDLDLGLVVTRGSLDRLARILDALDNLPDGDDARAARPPDGFAPPPLATYADGVDRVFQ